MVPRTPGPPFDSPPTRFDRRSHFWSCGSNHPSDCPRVKSPATSFSLLSPRKPMRHVPMYSWHPPVLYVCVCVCFIRIHCFLVIMSNTVSRGKLTLHPFFFPPPLFVFLPFDHVSIIVVPILVRFFLNNSCFCRTIAVEGSS